MTLGDTIAVIIVLAVIFTILIVACWLILELNYQRFIEDFRKRDPDYWKNKQ